MADSLPSPPASRSSSPSGEPATKSKDELGQRLDALLERYLENLDQYTKLREDLAKSFSNGFLSLANAQRTSNLGPGRRYGQDGYDERMKAQKRVSFNQSVSNVESGGDSKKLESLELSIVSRVRQPISNGEEGQDQASMTLETHTKKLSLKESEDPPPLKIDEFSTKTTKPKPDPAYRDPVTWYGILVPLPLRQTQTNFTSCVESTIPQLLSVTNALKSLESQIVALRTELGLQDQYENFG